MLGFRSYSSFPQIWSLLPLQQVSFASIVGLFCLYTRSLLPLPTHNGLMIVLHVSSSSYDMHVSSSSSHSQQTHDCIACRSTHQVSFASIVGLFCLYRRSLLPLQQVSFASIVVLDLGLYTTGTLSKSACFVCRYIPVWGLVRWFSQALSLVQVPNKVRMLCAEVYPC